MNNLNADLSPGTIVVLSEESSPGVPAEQRLFICDQGLGLSATARGDAIAGRFQHDNWPTEISAARDIDEAATQAHWARTQADSCAETPVCLIQDLDPIPIQRARIQQRDVRMYGHDFGYPARDFYDLAWDDARELGSIKPIEAVSDETVKVYQEPGSGVVAWERVRALTHEQSVEEALRRIDEAIAARNQRSVTFRRL